jgi:ABC-type bacteriocin/lantibiotic exporter with double-glycine peptidase domain
MSSTPPFVAQERPDSCAVACLRMLLAHRGKEVSEAELVRQTTLDEGGLTPAELAVLCRACGLTVQERILDDDELVQLVMHGGFPIVYLYRKLLDGVDNVHAVIPIGFSRRFVTLIRKFAQARSWAQRWAVIPHDA